MSVDFHTHSWATDGALLHAALLEQGKSAGVTGCAITDHDTLSGYQSVKDTGIAQGVGMISGVELSCRWASTTIHVVGLAFDDSSLDITSIVKSLSEARVERAKTIAHRLEKAGFAGA